MSPVEIIALGAVALMLPSNLVVRGVLRMSRGTPTPWIGAGRWIGTIERLLVYVLVISGEAGAAGLVIAAKSVLRYPEISGDPPAIDPEYVLVGSLTSWLLAFTVGAIVRVAVG